MFFVLVGLWILACIVACLLQHVSRAYLVTSCPCVAAMGFLAAGLLYLSNNLPAALIVLAVSVYLSGTILWSLRLQKNRTRSA